MANQKFNITFDANLNISQMKSALGEIQSSLAKLHLPQNVGKGLQETFQRLNQEVKNFEELSSKKINTKSDYGKLEKSLETIFSLYEKLEKSYKGLSGLNGKDLEKLFPENVAKNINNARQALENYNKELKKVRSNVINQSKKVAGIEGKIEAEKTKKVDSERYKELTKSIKEANVEIEKLKKSEIEAQKAIDDKRSSLKDPDKRPGKILPGLEENLRNIQKQLDEAIRKRDQLTAEKKVTTTESQQSKELQELNQQLEEAKQKLADFKAQQAQLESTTEGGGLQQLVQIISELLGLDLTKFTGDSKELGEVIERYLIGKVGQTQQGFNNIIQLLEAFGRAAKETGNKVKETGEETEEMNERMRDVQSLKSRIQYFFGLNNAINLVKRAIRGAYQTISELDKAMTETAVVTDFSVKDMWAQLPEYTKQANELGVSTLAAYQAATLYYQQGLKTNKVTALSTETLKMARIAGLDAAEATDRMTNALRGFNMELNETSAQRVDDVYSQLAARTASNVDEISTAMTKVASLANNANMQFETTAAFLAQIIETTRESAETAGTALKTVVARFSEVKKLYSEDQLKGADDEGEVINVNKVSEALRTAGIDLNKYFLGEVGLDDIFMELASKWDSLTKVQQRYIATQAAGSRQQSRFIALMSNYKRTQELVGEAYNANGAAAKQFEKTQDSLESKVARLKNAWNEFLMGLTNNDIVKGAIDLLTKLLNTVNSLTDAFGDNLGSVAKWLLVIAGFKGLKGLFSSGGIIEKVLTLSTKGTIFSGLTGKLAEGAAQTAPAKIGLSGLKTTFAQWGTKQMSSPLLGWAARGGYMAGASTMGVGTMGAGAAGVGTASGIGAGLGALGAALGYVAIAVGAVIAAYKLWLTFSLKGQLKDAQEYAKTMEKLAKDTKDTADSMSDAIKKSREYSKAINEATNNKQHNDAIKDRNEYITSLLEENEKFGEYVRTTFENGELVLTLDEDALAAAADKAAEAAVKASIGSSFAQATVAGRQVAVLQQKRDFTPNVHTQYDWEAGTATVVYGATTKTRKLTDKERADYTLLNQQIQQEKDKLNSYAQKAYAQMIDTESLENNLGENADEAAQSISEALAQGFDSSKLATSAWSWLKTRSDWQNEYLKAYGVEADPAMKTKDIARAVNQAELNKVEQQKTDDLSLLLSGQNGKIYQQLLDAFLGKNTFEGSNIFQDDISKLFGTDDINTLAGYIKDLGELLGGTDKVLANILKGIEQQKEFRKQAMARTAGRLSSFGLEDTNIEKYFKLDQVSQDLFSSIVEQFKDDKELGNEVANSLLSSVSDGKFNKDLQNWLSNIDFSDTAGTIKQIDEALTSSNDGIRNLAKSIKDSTYYEQNFSNTAKLQNFLLSQSYEDLDESLQKFIDDTGEISSENVLELAESNKELNALLKDGVINAKALGRVFTDLYENNIKFENLNKHILAALNTMDDLDGTIKKTIDDLNGFDAGYDENNIVDFISSVYENAVKNMEQGAIGNNAMRNQMEYIFGAFEWDSTKGSYGEQYEQWLNDGIKWLEDNKENLYSAWVDFLGAAGEANLDGVKIWKENGEILISQTNLTTEQLTEAIALQGKISKQQAAMMIADYKNYSAEFAAMMAQNDVGIAVEKWYDSINKSSRSFYLTEEIETLAAVLNTDADTIRQKLKEINSELKEFEWNNDISISENVEGAIGRVVFENIETSSYQLNYDQVKSEMEKNGLGQYFNQYIQEQIDKGVKVITTVFGKEVEIEPESYESVTQAYERAVEDATQSEFINKFKDMLENLEPTINIDGAEKKLTELIDFYNGDYTSAISKIRNVDINTTPALEKINELIKAVDILNKTSGVEGTSGGQTTTTTSTKSWGEWWAETFPNSGIGLYYRSKGKASGGFITGNEFALTGEEGSEIVWNKNRGYAYITGSNGPEFRNLQAGDRIFNAQDTQKIIKRSGFKSFDSGTISNSRAYGLINKTGSGSGSGDTAEDWKDRLDWLYNLMEDIAELERQQTILSEKYENTLKDVNATGLDLYNITKEQIANLQTQRDNYEEAARRRRQEMQERVTGSGYTDYVWWNNQDQTVEIDWDKINSVTDKDTYDQIKEIISVAEQIQSQIDDAEDNLREIDVSIKELYDRQLKTFTDFQSRVLDAVINKYQQQIDNLSDLNGTLTDTNNAILNSIRKEIDLQRQIRDNTETENSIRDLENRIAYLRRDTTGGNAQQIRELEKQLEEQTLSYGDQLIDQELERLNEKNDEAAAQRDKQIELMTASLDYQKRNGEFWPEVMDLINGGIGPNGTLVSNSKLVEILQQAEGWDALSIEQRKIWANELNETAHAVGEYLITISKGLDSISQGVWANIPSTSIGSAGGGSSSSGGSRDNTVKYTPLPKSQESDEGETEEERQARLERYRKNIKLNQEASSYQKYGWQLEDEYYKMYYSSSDNTQATTTIHNPNASYYVDINGVNISVENGQTAEDFYDDLVDMIYTRASIANVARNKK